MNRKYGKLAMLVITVLTAAMLLSAACAAEGTLNLPDNLTVIEAQAFYGMTDVTEIDIPENVRTIGNQAFYGLTNVTRIVVPDSVETIGDQAFGGSTSLVEVEVSPALAGDGSPETIAALEERILSGSPNAHIIVRVDDISKFQYRAETDHIVIEKYLDDTETKCIIPARIDNLPVTEIGSSAFSGNNTLTKVIIPKGVTTIGNYAFQYCYNLTDVTFPSTLTSVGRYAFYRCGYEHQEEDWAFVLPDNITSMDDWYFPFDDIVIECRYGSVTMNTLMDMGEDFCLDENHTLRYGRGYWNNEDVLFLNEYTGDREALTSVTIPYDIVGIGSEVFAGCVNLTDIHLPDSVRRFSGQSFSECGTASEGVFYFKLPDSLESIDTSYRNGAFWLCDMSKMVFECIPGTPAAYTISNISTQFTVQGKHDFRFIYKDHLEPTAEEQYHYEKRLFLMNYLGEGGVVAVPEETEILGRAFSGTSNSTENNTVTGVILPENLLALDSNAFYKCRALESVRIPDGITDIPNYAFYGCYALRNITIPATVTKIGSWAFSDCTTAVDEPVYYTLPENLQGYSYKPFDNCKAIPMVSKDSRTAKWLGGDMPDEMQGDHYSFTCTEETDYRYRYYKYSENDEDKYRLYLMKYVGNGTTASIPLGPEYIDGGAFTGNETVTKVVIPEGVTYIIDSAFRNCYNLTDITFPSTLKKLDQNVFNYCGRDAEVPFCFVLPNNMETIAGRGGGAQTFSDCNAILQTGKYSKTAELLTDKNFCYTVEGERDFRYRYESYTENGVTGRRLWLVGYTGTGTTVNIPEGIYGIVPFSSDTSSSCWRTFYGNAFIGNVAITKVVIPEGTVIIRDSSFKNCYNLTNISFPSTLKALDQNVFNYCGRNAAAPFYFILPDNMETMTGRGGGAQTFSDCNAVLQTGKYSKTAELLTDKNFCYTVEGEHDFRYRYISYTEDGITGRRLWLCGYVGESTAVSIPSGIYGIYRYHWDDRVADNPSFHNRTDITSVVIPEGTVVIEDSAFLGCTNLTSISFPESLKVLKNHAFEQCGKASEEIHYYFLPDDMEELSTNLGAGWGSFTDINKGRLVCSVNSETARLVSEVYTNHYNGYYEFAIRGHETDGLLYRYEQRKNANDETEFKLILRRYEGTSNEVTIPSGCGICEISADVFSNRTDLQKVFIPSGITVIHESAFNNCSMLHMSGIEQAEGQDCFVLRLPNTLKKLDGDTVFTKIGTLFAERFYFVLPSSLQELNTDMLRTCNAVFVAPQGSEAAARLYEAYFCYYNTLEDAVTHKNCQRRIDYDENNQQIPHDYYGRT